ncbi:hypothetical protein ALC57_18994 [Trachymyrmex cornetzi]|uniref:Odorant receptor n=1 Tax=Trachymyrmex cornetzi TaxID=471704 RepID=A0A195D846_9HYME|nr:hypothetical protein ALC57_18994 [Trachymyrmex cornetzi]
MTMATFCGLMKTSAGYISVLHTTKELNLLYNSFSVSIILNVHCNEIYYAAYSNEWYSVNPKIAQDLLFLLIRGAKPIYLTAGKMFPMTMMTFCINKNISRVYICFAYNEKSLKKSNKSEFFGKCYYFIKCNNPKLYFEWAVKLNRFALNLIGLWPKTAQNFRQKLMCNFRVLVVFLSVTLGLLIPSIHSLTRIFGDIVLMLDNLQFTLPAISCLIRIVIFWWKQEAVIPIINMIMKDWIKIKNDQERKLMLRRAQTARIIIICSYCIMGLQWSFISVLPIFGVTMRLTPNITDPGRIPMPLQSHYIYDITKRPQYELTFISQAVYVGIGMMAYTGVDNFLSLVVFHICGQLDILENRMQHLDKYKNYPKILKRCIEKHIRLLRAIDIIEDTYNGILLSLFIYFAILFAFYGFRIISVSIIETKN